MPNVLKPTLVLLALTLLISCGGRQEKRLAQNLDNLQIANLAAEDLKVSSFHPHGKDEAILVADVHTAFLMKKNSRGEWEIQSVRLGDRNWEDAKDFARALHQVRLERVKSDFEKIANALEKYQAQTKALPAVVGIGPLVDLLFPTYLAEAVRVDPWSSEYNYRLSTPTSYILISAGPDRKFGTGDDIRFER
ncbi:MAG: type II secretion system protein GspG [Acidobacteriia bacterium]|nr:type II secretion system protein GspG [Terriglobia bacterium]